MDDAIPLSVRDREGGVAAAISAKELATAKVNAKHASKIKGLLFDLDELNQSLMMDFRIVYVAYMTDPCGNAGLLNRQVETTLREKARFQMIRLQIRALIELATTHPGNHEGIMDAFQKIVQQVGGSSIPDAAADEIGRARGGDFRRRGYCSHIARQNILSRF